MNTSMLWVAVMYDLFLFVFVFVFLLRRDYSLSVAVHPAWGDVAVGSVQNPSVIHFHLKRSKCDQFGNRVTVFISRSGDEQCPVATVLIYITQRDNYPGAFFQSMLYWQGSGSPAVSRVQFSDYTGHSFQVGAATAAAQAGIQNSTIQMLGQWSSTAFLSYLQTPQDQLAQFTATLARV